MDETKFLTSVKDTQISSAANDDLEENQLLDLYGKVSQNRICNDDAKRGTSDISSGEPLRITESLNIDFDLAEHDDDHVPTRRYPGRNRVAPKRFLLEARKVSDMDMPSIEETVDPDDGDEWERSMKPELEALQEARTWDIVKRPIGVKMPSSKLVLKLRRNSVGKTISHKARLVIFENFEMENEKNAVASVVDFTIIRLILALAVYQKGCVHRIDYGSAFLQEVIRRVVYMMTPKFMDTVRGHVLKLKNTLYRLKESPAYGSGYSEGNLMSR